MARAITRSRVNKTPRIDPATMDALLAWAMRIVEDIGPDIRDAWIAYRQLHDGTHPSQERYDGLLMRDRVAVFLSHARQTERYCPSTWSMGGWRSTEPPQPDSWPVDKLAARS